MTPFKSLSITCAACAALCACGGGGDSASPNTGASPEGAYEGTVTAAQGSGVFDLLVLENGEYWALYATNVYGFIQGSGSYDNGKFTSTNAVDFGDNPPVSGSLTATYVAGTSINGSAAFAGRTSTFSGTVLPASSYNYNTAATIAAVQGSWAMTSANGSPVTLTIAPSGAFTGYDSGCSFSGTFTPRASGKNVFDVSVTFGGAPCTLPGAVGHGIGLPSVATSGRQELVVAGVTNDRAAGTFLIGQR